MRTQGTRTVSFRLTPEQYQALEARAAEKGSSVGEYARDMTLGEEGIAPSAARLEETQRRDSQLDALMRRVAWAVIVALSPEWDEDQTEAFLKEYLP